MATKKTATRGKRREKKNIERGVAHIQSTFNNTIVTITGLQPEKWASVVQRNLLRLQHKPQQKLLLKLQQSTV